MRFLERPACCRPPPRFRCCPIHQCHADEQCFADLNVSSSVAMSGTHVPRHATNMTDINHEHATRPARPGQNIWHPYHTQDMCMNMHNSGWTLEAAQFTCCRTLHRICAMYMAQTPRGCRNLVEPLYGTTHLPRVSTCGPCHPGTTATLDQPRSYQFWAH